jgi:hypothetical protein
MPTFGVELNEERIGFIIVVSSYVRLKHIYGVGSNYCCNSNGLPINWATKFMLKNSFPNLLMLQINGACNIIYFNFVLHLKTFGT